MYQWRVSKEKKKYNSLGRKLLNLASPTSFALPILAIITAFALVAIGPAKTNYAAQYLGCNPNGYIIRDTGGNTTFEAIDMVTGDGSAAGTVSGRTLNAIGYNPSDNHFYAWDLSGGVFVKLSSDLTTVTPFGPGNGMVGYSGTTNNIFSGDVDIDGHYWFFVGSNWYEADLSTGTPTIIDSGTATPAAGTNGTDWAFVPGTNKLYRGMDQAGVIHIWSFDRTTHAYNDEGPVANIVSTGSPNDGDMGSVYADPDGNFYMSSNHSGKLFRVDLSQAPNFTAVTLSAVAPNSNDGARCALASIPVDFGDAPSSYSTLITDDGPRHSIINFDINTSTAPLMLGSHIDIEEDGQPTAEADGDDNTHQGTPFVDDERGITQIVATPGNSDPLTVPVNVTNKTTAASILVGWIDLNNNGVFEASERVTANIPAGFVGTQDLTFPAPSAPYSVDTFARFRLFSVNDTSPAATGQLPTGPALGGEVEDVRVQVGSYDVSKTSDPADGSSVNPGATVTYTLTIKNTGATPLTDINIDDDLTDVLDDATLQGTPSVSPSGTATVDGNTLSFTGDIGTGQTTTITYRVQVNESGSLGNAVLNNMITAPDSASCDPAVTNGSVTVGDPCKTSLRIGGLANTGMSVFTVLFASIGLLSISILVWYFKLYRPRQHSQHHR